MNAKTIFFVLVMKENQETVAFKKIVEVKCSLNADVFLLFIILKRDTNIVIGLILYYDDIFRAFDVYRH